MNKTCKTIDCVKPIKSRSMCSACYERWRIGEGESIKQRRKTTCSLQTCDRKHYTKGFCYDHWKSIYIKHRDIKQKRSKADAVYKKRKRSKIKKGRLILNELTNTPATENKNLWNGIGFWSRNFSECVECNSCLYKHASKGVCKLCYDRLIYSYEPSKKRQYYNQNKGKWKEYVKQHIKTYERAINGEINLTPKIENILNS